MFFHSRVMRKIFEKLFLDAKHLNGKTYNLAFIFLMLTLYLLLLSSASCI